MPVQDSQEQLQDLDRLDFGEIKRFLARRWTLILGTAIAAAVLALVACLTIAPTFTATSQVILDPPKQRVFGQDGTTADAALDSAVVDSQIPIILSTRTLSSVVQREHLADDPEFAASARPGLLGRLFGFFAPRVALVEPPSLDGIDPKLGPLIARLFEHVDVMRIAKSNVLSITVSSHEARKAARLANAMAQAYVAGQVEVHAKSIQQAATFFEDRLGSLRDQVRLSERAVADFRNKYGLATTTDEKITVSEQQLTNLNERLAIASSDTQEKLAKYQQASHFKSGAGAIDTLPEIIRSPVISQLRAQQADVGRREADLSITYGAAYPALAQIRAQRQGLDASVAAEMKRLVASLKNDYEVARDREQGLRKTMATIGNPTGGDNDIGVKLRELERANLANKALFENFLNRAKLTQEQSTFEAPDARVISPALMPVTPSSPKTKLIVPIAVLAGLLLGLGLSAGLDVLRGLPLLKRAASSAASDVAILGYVPEIAAAGPRASDRLLDAAAFMSRNPLAGFSRAIQDLAARLVAEAVPRGRVLMLAPLTSDAGCSALARCLATALGAAGKRVLLIDADPIGRTLSIGLSLSSHAGLGEVLAATVPVGASVVPQATFAFLPIGQAACELSTAAGGRRMRAFLAEARPRFDFILIDAPARDAPAKAVPSSSFADGLILVASTRQMLDSRLIPTVDAVTEDPKFAGLILNRTSPPAEAREVAMAS